jgi:lipopolysaccharide transport system ATP-binding protein
MYGEAERVIPAYEFYQLEKDRAKEEQSEIVATSVDCPVIIRELEILNSLPLKRGDDLIFRILIECISDDLPYNVTLSIKMDTGRGVFVTGTHLAGRSPLYGKRKEIIVTYPNTPIMGGIYCAYARIFDDKGLMVYHEKVISRFDVEKDSLEIGVCYLENRWEVH